MATIVALSLLAGLVCVNAAEPSAPAAKKASAPSPKDGATDARRDGTVLSWTPGGTTGKYDVYFGTARKYVEQVERAVPVYVQASIGQTAKTFSPGRLELGQTYYWRVDEVDSTDPNAIKVVKGDVWSFMVETPVLPVGNITATTSCSIYENMGPEKTIDGSGLTGDLHSADMTQMWLSCLTQPAKKDPNDPNSPLVTPETWIQYQFDKVQKLQEMRVWNWNSGAEKYFGLGVKGATVKYSANGTDWTTLGDFQFAAAPGTAGYKYNTVVNFAGAAAKFVKIVIQTSHKGLLEFGLSEVKFFASPVIAREPSPASGTKNVAPDATLNWRAGLEAASHKVFISTDKAAVEKGTAPSFTMTTNSFKLTSIDVQLEKMYYWRVDEVNDAKSPKSFTSDVWNFTAVDYLVVDNFESFTDNLASAWTSASGTSVAIDKSVVRGGKQSLLMKYDTVGTPVMTATRTITSPKDWTKNGIKKLVVFYHGDLLNRNEPLYVCINNNSFVYNRDVTLKNPWWGYWIIDLSSVASSKVNSLILGCQVQAPGRGKLYIDDIRLYNTKTPALPDIVTQMVQLNGTGATKGQFDTLIAAVSAADLSLLEMLSSDETYTLLAPTNAAFTAAGINAKTDKAILNDILRNHIVAKNVSATDKGSVKTLEGSTLIQDANVVTDDLGTKAVITASKEALNGTIHTVNAVMMPFNMAKIVDILKTMNGAGDTAGKFDTLLAAIGAAKATVRDTLDKRHNTLFAPTDDAFAALGYDPNTIKKLNQSVLSDILLYHVVSGRIMGKDLGASLTTVQGGVLKHSKGKLTDTLGGEATITGFDVEGTNGVIHIVDAVGMPFAKTRLLDIVALIAALNSKGDLAGQFDTLIAAAEAADPTVLGTVAGAGPYTVFAPNDDAFTAINWDAKTVKNLNRVYLGDVLLYHIVAGTLSAKDAVAAKSIKTVQGGAIVPDPNDPNGVLVGAFAGRAKITVKDVAAGNGLIHAVSAVLLPYKEPAPPVVVPPLAPAPVSIMDTITALNKAGDYAGQFDTFLAAVAAADNAVLTALSGKADNTLFIPTDDAFAALGQSIGSLNKVVVTDILLYHIAAGKLMAADVLAAKSVTMLKGGSLQQADGVLTDNTGGKAKITGQDIKASNGVVHVINAVVLPAKL
jgi:transforming growth factor-beta-induced protein